MTRPFKQLAMNFVNSSILCYHPIDPFRFTFWSNGITGDVRITTLLGLNTLLVTWLLILQTGRPQAVWVSSNRSSISRWGGRDVCL